MTDTEDRLIREFDQHITDTHPGWGLDETGFNHRLQSPVEPCDRCGHRVFLLLPAGRSKPVWLQLGDVEGADTLFPQVQTRRHHCGDGESWSVEAALFVESAMAEWGMRAGGGAG
jgi:hypothetical protein